MSNNNLIIGKRIEQPNVKNHWQQLDLSSTFLTLSKPTILVLGGNNTTTAETANGNAKIVSAFLGKINEPVDVLSVCYSDNQKLDAKQIAQKLLFSLVCDNNGHKMPIENALKNARRINIFTHCAGATCLNYVLYFFEFYLNELGYSNKEQQQILGQIFTLNYAAKNIILNPHVKKVYIDSAHDSTLAEQSYNKIINSLLQTDSQDITIFPEHVKISTKKNIKNQIDKHLQNNGLVGVLNSQNNSLQYICTQQAAFDPCADNHVLNFITRDHKFNVPYYSSPVAHAISASMAETLLNSVCNSIINEHSQKPQILDTMVKFKDNFESIYLKVLEKAQAEFEDE